MHDKKNILRWLTLIATIFAIVVVGLGAYTRLKEAGLGCPDWPGCYGQWIAPASATKAWIEMIHRYAAGTLGLIIFAIAIYILLKQRQKIPVIFAITLIILVIFQAALGMWTVTLQLLPVVVMGHLLGGITILALLWSLHVYSRTDSGAEFKLYSLRKLLLIAIFLVFAQIALGGWVSSNYAALVCPHFPSCDGLGWPTFDFIRAFNIFSPIGVNYQGGALAYTSRVTIHMVHRFGALVVFIYLLYLSVRLWCTHISFLRKGALIMLGILAIQITLGILNAIWLLPLKIAVAHNLIAAILLLTICTLTIICYRRSDRVRVL